VRPKLAALAGLMRDKATPADLAAIAELAERPGFDFLAAALGRLGREKPRGRSQPLPGKA
jgi:hypothetical protein